MQDNYSYESALAASSRINWKVEDIIGGEKKLDFSKPFLPEALAQVSNLSFLTPAEKTTLNQIRGHEYLSMFGLVEEFILPYVVDHARPHFPAIKQQAEFNVESSMRATGRNLTPSEREEMTKAMTKGMRWTYLGTGMTHPNFLATVEAIKPEARKQIEEIASAFC